MKLKKRLEFKPKKVRITKDLKEKAEKHPHGARFGKRFFPYNKNGGQ